MLALFRLHDFYDNYLGQSGTLAQLLLSYKDSKPNSSYNFSMEAPVITPITAKTVLH